MTLSVVAPDWADPPERHMQVIQRLPGAGYKAELTGNLV